MRISVITPSFNSAVTIRDTLACVASQQYTDVEHIVVDGDSADNTLEIVRAFNHVSKMVSEKDHGLYHAMNKGIQLAGGDIIGILNSDDIYHDETILAKVADAFRSPEVHCVYGDLQYVHQHNLNKVIRTWKAGLYHPKNFLYGWMPPHPTFFVRKKVYDEVGLFDTSLRSSADYEMMLRILYKHNFHAAYIPEILVKMRTGGLSNSSLRHRFKANREDAKAWKLIGRKPHFFTVYLKPLRKIPQFLIK